MSLINSNPNEHYMCTVCKKHVRDEDVLHDSLISHPILKVLICEGCHSYFAYDHKAQLDRLHDLCLWCYKSGELKACSICDGKFCMKCLKQNLELEEYTKLCSNKRWICVICDSKQIYKLQSLSKKFVLNMRMTTRGVSNNSQGTILQQTSNSRSKLRRRKSWNGALTQSAVKEEVEVANYIKDEDLGTLKDNCDKKADELIHLCNEVNAEVLTFKTKIAENFTAYKYIKGIEFLKETMRSVKLNLSEWESEVEDWRICTKSIESKNLINGKRKFNLSIRRWSDSDTNDDFSNKMSEPIVEKSLIVDGDDQPKEVEGDTNHQSPKVMEVVENEVIDLHHSDNSCDSIHSIFSHDTAILEFPEAQVNNEERIAADVSELDEKREATVNQVYSSDSESSFVFNLDGYIPNDSLTTDDMILEEMEKENYGNCDIKNVSLHIKDNLLESTLQIEDVDFNNTSLEDFDFQQNVKNENDLEQSEFLGLLHLTPKASLIEPHEEEGETDQEDKDPWEKALMFAKETTMCFSDSGSLSDTSEIDEFHNHFNLPKGIHGSISYGMPKLPETPECEALSSPEGTNVNEEIDYLQYYNIKPCSVILHKVSLCETVKCARNNGATTDNEIERLVNLDNIERKRKISPNTSKEKAKKPKIKSKSLLSDSDDNSDSEISSIASADEDKLLNDVNIDGENENDDEAGVFDAIMQAIMEEDVEIVNESDSEGCVNTSSKKVKRSISRDSNKENIKQETNEESKEGKEQPKNNNWQSDKLLHFNLNERLIKPSKTNEGLDDLEPKTEKVNPKNKKAESGDKLEDCDNVSIISDSDDDDFELRYNKIVINSESDSDIEFVSVAKNKDRNKSTLNDIDVKSIKSEGKGRRNIRSILGYDTLSQSTKEANLAEKERKFRLSQKQKHMDLILSQSDTERTDGLILDIDEETKLPVIVVDPNLTSLLKSHQQKGIKFMWESCYEGVKQISSGDLGSGCILAHCMGLGKTLQVITLIHTLFTHPVTKTKWVLIVCPLSVVNHWVKEFADAFKHVINKSVSVHYISELRHKSKKSDAVLQWSKGGGVLILGYERFSKLTEDVDVDIQAALCNPGPDLIVLDEGHILKNQKSCRFASLMKVKTKRRIVLTGTPLQNNLNEYYYMIQCVKPNLLGSKSEYTNRFTNPITNGQYDDSTDEDIIKMKKRSHVLHKLLKNTIQRFEASELLQHIPKKRDFAVFVDLHDIQKKLYDFIIDLETKDCDSSHIRDLIRNYHQFQTIWTHIHLFRLKHINKYSLPVAEVSDMQNKINAWWEEFGPKDSDTQLDYGPKFKVMLGIINECQKIGDKVLVFANSLLELSAIQHFLEGSATPSSQWIYNKDYFRMDGSTPLDKRHILCKKFNDKTNTRGRLFLISLKVGGLGLNLVGANRVILMDVNWNPAVDDQGVYRVCRFGQEKEAYVYRLVSLGTMEEVVYERQVTKLAVSARVVDCLQISRHYKSTDLQEIYRSKFTYNQPRPILPPPDDVVLANVYTACKEIVKYHEHQSLLENLPDENLNETEMKLAWDEFNEENERREQMRNTALQNATLINSNRTADPNLSTISRPPNQALPYSSLIATEGLKKIALPYSKFPVQFINNQLVSNKSVNADSSVVANHNQQNDLSNVPKIQRAKSSNVVNVKELIDNYRANQAQLKATQQNNSNNLSKTIDTQVGVTIKKLFKNPVAMNSLPVSKPSHASTSLPMNSLPVSKPSHTSTSLPSQQLANGTAVQPTDSFIIVEEDDDIRKKKQHDLLTTLNSNANITLSAIFSASKEKSSNQGDVIEID